MRDAVRLALLEQERAGIDVVRAELGASTER